PCVGLRRAQGALGRSDGKASHGSAVAAELSTARLLLDTPYVVPYMREEDQCLPRRVRRGAAQSTSRCGGAQSGRSDPFSPGRIRDGTYRTSRFRPRRHVGWRRIVRRRRARRRTARRIRIVTLIIDAAPLVALGDTRDPLHSRVGELLREEPGELVVPAPV